VAKKITLHLICDSSELCIYFTLAFYAVTQLTFAHSLEIFTVSILFFVVAGLYFSGTLCSEVCLVFVLYFNSGQNCAIWCSVFSLVRLVALCFTML